MTSPAGLSSRRSRLESFKRLDPFGMAERKYAATRFGDALLDRLGHQAVGHGRAKPLAGLDLRHSKPLRNQALRCTFRDLSQDV
jgi:hypothetical protein